MTAYSKFGNTSDVITDTAIEHFIPIRNADPIRFHQFISEYFGQFYKAFNDMIGG